jgi:hypothetical protein
MPTSRELTIRTENRPGTLGKLCQTLADQKVNILAFQAVPADGNSSIRIVVDNPATAKKLLDAERLSYTEAEVAQAKLPNRPGELAHAASQLGGSNINIEYALQRIRLKQLPSCIFRSQRRRQGSNGPRQDRCRRVKPTT